MSPAVSPASSGSVQQGHALQGKVFGGQQPIAGAHIYLFAAGIGGYGTASTSLLTGTGNSDGIGGYVLTDAGGNFSITGDYACTQNTQVYLYALGGNTGTGLNSHASSLAVLGNCPASQSFSSQIPYIIVNEVSTVAAAFALSGFSTDATDIGSSGSAQALTGIGNAAATAGQMYALNGNTALAQTPAGNGTVPQTTIHTIANILAACVNTFDGPANAASATCSTLFANATNGTTAPIETATAAINIAHHPAANVHALYTLISSDAPFVPALSAEPDTLALMIGYSSANFSRPTNLAVDASGNLWVTNTLSGGLDMMTPLGVVTSVSSSGVPNAVGIAVDSTGDLIWLNSATLIASYSQSAGRFVSSDGILAGGAYGLALDAVGSYHLGAYPSTTSGSTSYMIDNVNGTVHTTDVSSLVTAPFATAITADGYSWTTTLLPGATSGKLLRVIRGKSTTTYATFTAANYAQGSGIAADAGNNLWISEYKTGALIKFVNEGASSTSFTGGGLNSAPLEGVAVDGLGNVWTASISSRLIGVNNSGTPLTGSSGILLPTYGAYFPVVDLSGNVWVASGQTGLVIETVGVAAPTVMPLALGVKNSALGTRP